jgi:hypothetical protein
MTQRLDLALQCIEAIAFRRGYALALDAVDFISFDHPSNVWLAQPILGAMESIADHCYGYSSRCSRTMDCTLPDFSRKIVRLVHGSICSRVQASTKLGRFSFVAVHPGAAPHARVNGSMSALKQMGMYFC